MISLIKKILDFNFFEPTNNSIEKEYIELNIEKKRLESHIKLLSELEQELLKLNKKDN